MSSEECANVPWARSERMNSQAKRKAIQQQLVILLHAHKCEQDKMMTVGTSAECRLPHCGTMRGVIRHISAGCRNGDCKYPHCASSRELLAHWKNCKNKACPVCQPLRTVKDVKTKSEQVNERNIRFINEIKDDAVKRVISETFRCKICCEKITLHCCSNCFGAFCGDCFINMVQHDAAKKCPFCRQESDNYELLVLPKM